MFKALERAINDHEFSQMLESFQASIVDAVIQSLTAEQVGRAFQNDDFHWKQSWVGQSEEHRTFFMGKRPMGVLRCKLTSGDKVNLEAELFEPDRPEDLVGRDPMQFKPGESVMSIQRKKVLTEPSFEAMRRVKMGKPN